MDTYKINLIVFDKFISPNVTMIVKRFNRTIRDKITQYMDSYDTHNYTNVIDKLTKNYNNSIHSSLTR